MRRYIMIKKRCTFSALALGAWVGLSIIPASHAWAITVAEPYTPPEVAYASDLQQKITLPGKIDINEGNFNQLKILPGFNEELALKVMRCRPFEEIQDFYRKLPELGKQNIDLLIRQIQPKIQFK